MEADEATAWAEQEFRRLNRLSGVIGESGPWVESLARLYRQARSYEQARGVSFSRLEARGVEEVAGVELMTVVGSIAEPPYDTNAGIPCGTEG